MVFDYGCSLITFSYHFDEVICYKKKRKKKTIQVVLDIELSSVGIILCPGHNS